MKTIAFIPVRGGSKSIPKKNIKLFCGKPLVYWITCALQNSKNIDEIVVAADSEEIIKTVIDFGFNKVKIYRRLAANASDSASTESVMLEYINAAKLNPNTTFILAQATSPLTKTLHVDEALSMFAAGSYDSLLSCVRTKRFFWNVDGTAKNYDYKNRPRRQDFAGEWMENGALYINSVGNILQYNNRLCGKIGIYEMPEYTATEIDEPDDWMILENLMYRYLSQKKKIGQIKLFLSDVDGVMTDAGMYYSDNGDELKKFNTHDGMAFQLLKEAGIKTGIITSEITNIVERRANKLKADYLYQGKCWKGKLTVAKEICDKEGFSLEEVAYIGDDINCYELLNNVGLAACPANSLPKIKNINGIIILEKNGGEGAVREFVEKYIL